MATRGRIGMVADNGNVVSIYNHWDSYPSGVGSMLIEHYTDKDKVEKLIGLGDISSLHEEVDIPEGMKHSFDNPLENITIAYGRDRGEKGTAPRFNGSEDEYWKSDIEEYGYLFKDGEWYVKSSWDENCRTPILVKDAIQKF